MMKRLKDDCLAEMALGRGLYVALILVSVLGGLLLGLAEFTFAESKQHASHNQILLTDLS